MRNLAGVKEADVFIQEELLLAGIDAVKGELNKGEVPYTITGKVGNWSFRRAWYYWIASAPEGEGLPLVAAQELHNRPYPIEGDNRPKTYGQVVRVGGDCGCPPPEEGATHYDAQGLELVVDPEGKELAQAKICLNKMPHLQKDFEKLRFVLSLDGIVAKSVVDSYHIDSQLGLNEFARVVRESRGE